MTTREKMRAAVRKAAAFADNPAATDLADAIIHVLYPMIELEVRERLAREVERKGKWCLDKAEEEQHLPSREALGNAASIYNKAAEIVRGTNAST